MSEYINRAKLFNALASAQDKGEIFSIIQGMEADVIIKEGEYKTVHNRDGSTTLILDDIEHVGYTAEQLGREK